MHRAAIPVALLCQFQDFHYVQNLFRGDLDGSFSENRIAKIGIEEAVVSGSSGNGAGSHCVRGRRVKDAPLVRWLSAPGIVTWNLAALERRLLWINPIFNKRSLRAANEVA